MQRQQDLALCFAGKLPFQLFLSNFFPFSSYTKNRTSHSLFPWCSCTSGVNCHKGLYCCLNFIVEMLQQDFSVKVDAVNFHNGEIWSWAPYSHSTWVYLTLKRASSQRNSANILTVEKDYCTGKLLPIILFLSFIIGLSGQWVDKSQLN